jgi:hypothetical protein
LQGPQAAGSTNSISGEVDKGMDLLCVSVFFILDVKRDITKSNAMLTVNDT